MCEVVLVVSKDDDSVELDVPSKFQGRKVVRPGRRRRVRRGETYGGTTHAELAAADVGSRVKLRKRLTDEECPSTP